MRISNSGDVGIGADGIANSGGNRLAIDTGVNAAAVTSGTTQTGGALRLRGGDNAVLDFGLNSVNTWIQATDKVNLANGYALSLNPNGGNVGINTASPISPLHVYGRLHHNATTGTTHTGASNTAHSITNTSIIGDKLRFSIQVYFQNGTSNLAIRIYVNITSLWLAGEVCIGSTYSNASATGLNRYSFSHNYNTTTNYGYHLAQTENFGQVPSHFTFHSHGYDSTEGAHYFEFRHITSTGNTMFLQFEGNGSSPAHANLATWYYKHKTY